MKFMAKIIKNIIILFIPLSIVLILFVLFKTLTHPFSSQNDSKVSALSNDSKVVSELAVKRFSEGLQIPTVSYDDISAIDFTVFQKFIEYLGTAYPEIHKNTEHYTINNYSIVYKWAGKNPNLKPILFLSHYDVVAPGDFSASDNNEYKGFTFSLNDAPIPPASDVASAWEYPPFSGAVANGRIYGRGTLDMKNMLFSILEAADKLMKSGFTPQRDIYFAFGHDEEIGGINGATKIAADFAAKKITFDTIYDEGGIIATEGSIGGLSQDIALVGFAEKGVASYRVKVKGLGGHSSMPPLETAIGKAAMIMRNLEDQQMKQEITPPIAQFLNNIGGSMPFTRKMVIANQWLFKSALLNSLAKEPATNALTRTTTALTMMKGSDASNVLPPVAEFVVNFRILPTNTVESVLAHLTKASKGLDVNIEPVRLPQPPSNISPENTRGYQVVKSAIGALYPETIISPYITIGGTDAVKYQGLSDNIYRFSPMAINLSEQRSIHNQNEYISIKNYMKMIQYFELIMKNYDEK